MALSLGLWVARSRGLCGPGSSVTAPTGQADETIRFSRVLCPTSLSQVGTTVAISPTYDAPPHHSLVAWQRADDLFIHLHAVSHAFPAAERFELGKQLRRAAFSVPVNIVEGFGRHSRLDRLQFLQIALSSLAEVGYCIHVAQRLKYFSEAEKDGLEVEIRKVSAPLRGLMKSLGREHP